jgi:2-dehydro-3-deoxygalactonokinase
MRPLGQASHCIAIDSGTTNTRARLLRGNDVVASSSRAVGARDVATSGSKDVLRRAIADCVGEAVDTARVAMSDIEIFCASGMLTSNVGLCEIPHVRAPAGPDELARHVKCVHFPDIAPKPIHFIPGVRTQPADPHLDNLDQLDILRGEECEAVGILEAIGRAGPLSLLLPGSHTKLLDIEEHSRITRSYTTIGGELLQVLAENTILAGSIQWPPDGAPDWEAFDRGVDFVRRWGIARSGFAIRLADVLARASKDTCTWILLGQVVGSDWDALLRSRSGNSEVPLLIGGRTLLREAYGRLASTEWRAPVEVLSESVVEPAAARGAVSIARRRESGVGSEDRGQRSEDRGRKLPRPSP